jgi:hypothetical protein
MSRFHEICDDEWIRALSWRKSSIIEGFMIFSGADSVLYSDLDRLYTLSEANDFFCVIHLWGILKGRNMRVADNSP